jgi:hypothetical protein
VQFLIFVVVASAAGICFVVLRNRPRTGMDASIDEFQRGLRAIAPGRGPHDASEPTKTTRSDEQGAGRSG